MSDGLPDAASRPPGLVALMSPSGEIVSVLLDSLGVSGGSAPLSNLVDWVDADSREKARLFLERVAAEGNAFDWETNASIDDHIVLLHLWGIRLQEDALLMAGVSREALYQLYDQITVTDDARFASLGEVLRGRGPRPGAVNANEEALYEELSRTNNELVNLQRELAKTNAELEAAVEQLDAFAHSVSHDLRTPLMHISGFVDILVEDHSHLLDDEGLQLLGWVSDGAVKMEEMINGILAYSRLSRSQLSLTRVDLASVVDEALLQALGMSSLADMIIARPMPWVLGYRPILVQMVANLLSNAVKFVAPGVRPRVQIRAETVGRRAERVRVWVEDNGIGIAPEHQERIFGLFGRLHSDDEYQGTGVGLSIVRVGAERMGGSAGVVSAPGAGSRFWIELARTEESIE